MSTLATDEDTEQLISDAAALLQVSKTAFVEDAVRAAARRVIARSDVTLMDPAVFDSMMSALLQRQARPHTVMGQRSSSAFWDTG